MKSTYDEFLENLNKEQMEQFEKGYKELLLSELIQAVMKEDNISVRQLAKAAGVSPTIIQGLRKGKRNVTLETVSKVLDTIGYELAVQPKLSTNS